MSIVREEYLCRATFSANRMYRYRLERIWRPDKPRVVWILLNPSTADATQDDPTIRRCIQFAKDWGYSGVLVLNLFAFRSTSPKAMLAAADPIGDHWSHGYDDQPSDWLHMAAWGVHGAHSDRDLAVAREIIAGGVPLHCLGTTADGHPRHPLYVKGDTQPVPFIIRKSLLED